MKRLWTVLVKILTSDTDNYEINESVFIIVLLTLLIALLISFMVAKKNNLYHKPVSKETPMNEVE
jgi:Mn2+/Fe2+ NRAMP family transporter